MSNRRIAPDPWGLLVTLMAQALSPDLQPGRDSRQPDAPRYPPAPRPGLLDRLDTWLWRQRQRSVEATLAQSKDVFELEARMRALERPYGARLY